MIRVILNYAVNTKKKKVNYPAKNVHEGQTNTAANNV
jgi:hypothetical protein